MSTQVHQFQQILEQLDEEVERGIANVLSADGYVDEYGEPSDDAMRDAAFKVIVDNAVANSKAERSKRALTKGDLYAAVFPSGPKDEDANGDPVQQRILDKLSSAVWGLTQTARSGYVQRRFDEEESTLVLCRTKVYRNAEQKQAVYATDSEVLIKEDAVDKEIKALAKRVSAVRRDFSMLIERHPKLRKAISDQLGVEVRKMTSELDFSADPAANGSRKQLNA